MKTNSHRCEDLSAHYDHLRRRSYWLTGVAIVILAASGFAVVVAVNDAKAARAALAHNASAPVSLVEPAPPAIEIALPKPAEVKPLPKMELSQKDRFLETVGTLSAAHLFQSYLNIGLLADGVESDAYSVKEATETLQSIESTMDQVEAQLGKLTKADLERDDRAAIEQIKAVAVLLRLQAKFLRDYWKSNEKADADRYHEVRAAAWKGLGKVMQP